MDSIEASGKSVEDAIAQALVRLGKKREEVDIAILQEPSRGTFGLGSKDARVRVTVRLNTFSTKSAVITPELADALLGPDDVEVSLPDDEVMYDEQSAEFIDDGAETVEDENEDLYEIEEEEEDIEDEEEEVSEDEEERLPFIPTVKQGLLDQLPTATNNSDLQDVEHPSREDVEITVDVLQHILRYMNIHATVQVRSHNPLTLNIYGINENLGLLIGRRGETLSALQLLVSLIVSHRTKHRMRIVVDAENYRERREENLRSLALRVAQQVRNYRRSIALEAMPPNERRIVHIALSESKDISTESIGEGEERRVVVSLKRSIR